MKLNLDEILRELKPYRSRQAVPDPEYSCLLAIDLQNYFKRIVLPILKNLLFVLQTCRKRNLPIIFTQHGHRDPSKDGRELSRWWGELILEGTKDWEFLPEIKVESKDIIIPKKHYSAFFETNMDQILKTRGIRDLIISGVMTNLCCETTARDGFMRDYRVFFLIDVTATGRIDLHLSTLKNLGFGFAYLITCEELIQILNKHSD